MLWPDLAAAMTPPDGKAAPSMSTVIRDENDKDFRLDSLQGQPVLVNFWATWCPPCVAELPALDNAAKQLGDDVTLLLISVDRGGRKKALPFLQDRGITRPLIGFDPISRDSAALWSNPIKGRVMPRSCKKGRAF